MSTVSIVVLAVVVPLIALYIHRLLSAERIQTIDGNYTLPWHESFVFEFRVSFPSEAAAKTYASLNVGPGVTNIVEVSPNGQRWATTWRIEARGAGRWYRDLSERILAAAAQCGLNDPTIVATCRSPGTGIGLVLATHALNPIAATIADSFEPPGPAAT